MGKKRKPDVAIRCPGCGKLHKVKHHRFRGFLRRFAREATIQHGHEHSGIRHSEFR